MFHRAVLLASLLSAGLPASATADAGDEPPAGRVTILYDAFGNRRGLTRDWGFAALVEYDGRRILFDTGNDAEVFAHNVSELGVDLRNLDFVVVSHRHGDHIAGLNHLLEVNPDVTIYAPREGFGVFGASLPGGFYRRDAELPDSMRYFGGVAPERLSFGTPWPRARIALIDTVTTVAPGVAIVSTVSTTPGTLELRELSLVLQTPQGLVVLVGCSHPGIETILAATRPLGSRVRLIVGGLHLVTGPDSTVRRISTALRDRWRVHQVAPGHCTGEPAFAALRRVFGARNLYAGLGTELDLD